MREKNAIVGLLLITKCVSVKGDTLNVCIKNTVYRMFHFKNSTAMTKRFADNGLVFYVPFSHIRTIEG